MDSLTKPVVGHELLEELARAAFGMGVTAGRELADGMYNAAFWVTLADGREVVLKVAPAPGLPRLSYELDILRTETLFLEHAARLGPGVPTPRVLATGFERTLVPGDYLFMSALPGRRLDQVRDELSGAEHTAVRADLGRIVAALHTVRGTAFGYPQPEPAAATWAQAFLGMVDAVLADAAAVGADLTRPAREIHEAVRADAGLLDAVTTPVLVHFDLWDANILVERDGGARVSGVIDGERAFWGDPCADFVCLSLAEDITADRAFLDGYRAAGGLVEFTPDVRRRISLYRLYLCLIVLTEIYPRGYDAEHTARTRAWAGDRITTELAALAH